MVVSFDCMIEKNEWITMECGECPDSGHSFFIFLPK